MRFDWRALIPDPIRLALCLAAILIALGIGIRAATPPAALPASAPPTQFSAARAMADIGEIGVAPHPTGSAEASFIAGWLDKRLKGLGMTVERRRYLVDDETRAKLMSWSNGQLAPNELENVFAVLPGRDRTLPAVMLTAHYDTVWASPGAADDSIGVATAIETLRAIRAKGQPQRDVVLLFTDAEETGLAGARAFWGDKALADRIGVVINLESRGAGGRALMFETGEKNGGMIAAFARDVARPVGNSLAALAYQSMPNRTDFTIARKTGVQGFNYAVVDRAAYYHSPAATPDKVDPRSVQDMGDQVLGLAADFAAAKTLPDRAADAAFFDLPGGHLVHYATGWGWIVLLAGIAATAIAWWRARPPLDTIAGGTLGGLWAAAMASLVLTVLNLASGSASHLNYYDRLAALPRLEMQAALAVTAVLIAATMLRPFPIRIAGVAPPLLLAFLGIAIGAPVPAVIVPALLAGLFWTVMPRDGAGAWGGWIGLTALLLFLGVVAQVAAPPAAWLVAWPALVAGVALLAAAAIGRTLPVLVIASAAGAAVLAALIPFAHLLMLNIGGPAPEFAAVFAPLVLAPFWPVVRMRPGLVGGIVVTACLLLALVFALSVRLDAIAPTIPPYSLDKVG